jgi:hypothetical protein
MLTLYRDQYAIAHLNLQATTEMTQVQNCSSSGITGKRIRGTWSVKSRQMTWGGTTVNTGMKTFGGRKTVRGMITFGTKSLETTCF